MYERHEHEQYFFDEATLEDLTDFVTRWQNPCCLCTPLLGQRIAKRGETVTILDNDARFASVDGFRAYDLYRPDWLGDDFDLIVVDPPFFRVSLSQLFHAVRLLARHDLRQPLLIAYLKRRESALLGTFARFELRATGYRPGYQTVRDTKENEIELFSNLPASELEALSDRR